MTSFARRIDRVRPSAIRELLQLGEDSSIISFGGGYPDPSLFPLDGLRQVFTDLLRPGHEKNLQYTVAVGMPALREQIAQRMAAHGTPCRLDDVLVVQGAQQGLDLVGKLLLDPGDTVVVDNPTFLGAVLAFAPYEPTYAVVPTDDDGMDTEALETALRTHPRTKLIYTMPDFHNPTGVTLSLERRRRMLELADRYDVVVAEDTPYRELRYDGSPVPTMKSLDSQGRVVYLGTFSKILAPGMRLGWVVAAPALLDKLGMLKLAADTQSSTLNMAAASAFLTTFDLDAHIATLCAAYRAKRDVMLSALDESFPGDVSWTRPDGGLFTWVTFPDGFDATAFMRDHALPHARVAYVPGASFFAVEEETNHARFSFSVSTPDQIAQGVKSLADALAVARGR